MELLLASTSPYRRQQLAQLGWRFEVLGPQVDEVMEPGEAPEVFALRMAEAKALSVAATRPDAFVIGGDQVCAFNGEVVRKPGNHENARAQLLRFSGQRVDFYSALAVVKGDRTIRHNTLTAVFFRTLSDDQIERYLQWDQPYDCAGSFKVEQAGLTLMRSVQSDDPSALMGLPLIALSEALRTLGYPS